MTNGFVLRADTPLLGARTAVRGGAGGHSAHVVGRTVPVALGWQVSERGPCDRRPRGAGVITLRRATSLPSRLRALPRPHKNLVLFHGLLAARSRVWCRPNDCAPMQHQRACRASPPGLRLEAGLRQLYTHS